MVPAGQEPAAERVVDHGAQARDGRVLDVLLLDTAREEVVQLLGDDRAGRADLVGHAAELGDLPGRVVGHAEGADLPLGDELGHGRQGFGERRRTVRLVQVEEVDMVGAEPLEAAVQGGAQSGRRQGGVIALVGVRDTGLGGEDDPVAAAREQFPEQSLALAARVAVGGVHTRDAGVERGVQHGRRTLAVDGVAEGHGAEHQPRERDGGVRQGEAGGHEELPSSTRRGFTPWMAVGSSAARRSARV